jgi:hypothetical protein
MSSTYHGPWTWEGLADHLGDADEIRKDERPVANNTRARWTCVDGERNGCIAVRFHSTDVVVLSPIFDDHPVLQLYTGGWSTVTTADRINRALDADHGAGEVGHFYYGKGIYAVAHPMRRHEYAYNDAGYFETPSYTHKYAFLEGMVIDLLPGPSYGHPMPAHRIPVDRNGNKLAYAGPGPEIAGRVTV